MSDIFVRSSETWGNNNFTVVSVISRNQDDVNFYLLLIVENSSYVVRYKSTNVGAHLKPSSARSSPQPHITKISAAKKTDTIYVRIS
jgi:hypothetical protein